MNIIDPIGVPSISDRLLGSSQSLTHYPRHSLKIARPKPRLKVKPPNRPAPARRNRTPATAGAIPNGPVQGRGPTARKTKPSGPRIARDDLSLVAPRGRHQSEAKRPTSVTRITRIVSGPYSPNLKAGPAGKPSPGYVGRRACHRVLWGVGRPTFVRSPSLPSARGPSCVPELRLRGQASR